MSKVFESEAIYRQWIQEESENGKFSLVKRSRDKEREYLMCNRSGKYTTKDEAKRAPKLVEGRKTIKIGFDCSTFVNAKFHDDGQVTVKYCFEHYGHEKNVAILPIPPRIESVIAQMLAEDRGANYIIEKMQEMHSTTVDDLEQLGREHFLSKDDIRNIKERQGLDTAKKDPVDSVSVRMWVEEMKEKHGSESPLFCYEHNEDGYFSVALEVEKQMKMFKDEGERAVCMDSTHGLTDYNLKLITIIVLDKRDKGYPVAWLLTTNEDKVTLLKFFYALRARIGDISTKIFMSDCAQSFWNAWKEVFTTSETKRYWCTWHVQKAWGENIRSKVHDKEHVAYITSMTELLMHCEDVDEFNQYEVAFEKYLEYYDETDFLNYWKSYYMKEDVKPLWAYCYSRDTALFNTNMLCEAFHRNLKHVILESKINRRTDRLLDILFKCAETYEINYAKETLKPTLCLFLLVIQYVKQTWFSH